MRIHRVHLRNYRGVADAEITFPDTGVTIVEGDNEVGKTSLSEAIDLVLSERHDSGKARLRAVKPVGKDVGAEVEIELTTGPYRFRLRKRWHRQKETELEVFEPARLQLSGREAHDRVREMLDETLDGDLFDALQLQQGKELRQASFVGGSLGRALDLAAGGDAAGDREDDLWARITEERDRYWTASGQAKVDRTAAAARVEQAAALVADLEARLRSLEDDAAQVERLVAEHGVLQGKQLNNNQRLAELETQFEAIKVYRNEVDRLRLLHDAARVQHERAVEVLEARDLLNHRLVAAGEAVALLQGAAQDALPARAEAQARLVRAQKAVDAARDDVRRAELAERQAIADRDYRRQQIELAQLSERHERVVESAGRQAEANAVLDASRVDTDLVERIEDAHLEFARAQASAESAAATVCAEVEQPLELQVDGNAVALRAGTPHTISVTGSVRLEVPGLLSLEVQAGPEAQALASRQAEAQAALASLCEQGGVCDLAEARKVAAARADAERVLVEVARSIAQDLRDLTPEALAQKVQQVAAHVAAFEAERSAESPVPADLDAAQVALSRCTATLVDHREQLERLEKDLADAADAVREVDVDDATAKVRLEHALSEQGQVADALRSARTLASDEVVAEQVAGAVAALHTSTAELAAAEQRLEAEDPASTETMLDNARDVRKRLADQLHSNEIATGNLRTTLALRGEEGLANQLDAAKSDLVRATMEHERLEARAAAAKLLHDTFAERRAEAHHRYVAPFRDKIQELGRLVFGRDLEVTLDDELRIARRTLGGVTLDFDDLSTGAQEQLGMISRLACASIVAADGGAPVIFDDALGWSDPGRLERMGAAIASAGRSCQVIVLTCTPGRYESVGNATVVHLPN